MLIQDPHVVDGRIARFPLGWLVAASITNSCAVVVTDKRLQIIITDRFENSVFVNITSFNTALTVGTQYSAPSANLTDDLKD